VAERGALVFSEFLRRSLDVLANEAPQHFSIVRRRMRGLAVNIGIDGPPSLRVQLDAEPWVGPAAPAPVRAEIAARDMTAVLAGLLTIEQALDTGGLLLQGELDHLLGFLDALSAWIHGAVRCESMPGLYAAYLARADGADSSQATSA
jgi:hypothetical protein